MRLPLDLEDDAGAEADLVDHGGHHLRHGLLGGGPVIWPKAALKFTVTTLGTWCRGRDHGDVARDRRREPGGRLAAARPGHQGGDDGGQRAGALTSRSTRRQRVVGGRVEEVHLDADVGRRLRLRRRGRRRVRVEQMERHARRRDGAGRALRGDGATRRPAPPAAAAPRRHAPGAASARRAPRRRRSAAALTASAPARRRARPPRRRRRSSSSPFASTGSDRTKRAPPSGDDSTRTSPCMTCMCSATSASPSPVPVPCPAGPRPSRGRSARTPWRARPGRCPARRRRRVTSTSPGPAGVIRPRPHRDRRHAAAVVVRVLHQVHQDALEAPLVDADPPPLHLGVHDDLGRAVPAAVHVPDPGLHRAPHQLGDVDLLQEDVDRAGVGPGHLEQVAHHALEPPQVVAQELRGRAASGRAAARGRSRARRRPPTASSSGERSSWLTSELNRASRSIRSWSWSTMALNEVVSPTRSGSAASMSSRVSSSPPAMAPAASDVTSESGRSSRRLAKRPERDPEQRRHRAGDEERQAQHAHACGRGRRGRTPRSRRRAPTGPAGRRRSRPCRPRCGTSASPPSRPGPRCAAAAGMEDALTDSEDTYDLGAVVQHRVGAGAGVDLRQQATRTACRRTRGSCAPPTRWRTPSAGPPTRGPPSRKWRTVKYEIPPEQDREHQRPEAEDGRDAGADAQLHVRGPACSPCP